MAILLFVLTLVTVVTVPASADVVELVSGERIEGKSAKATDERVTVEVGGQTLGFDRDKVRAIYFGAPPSTSASPSSAREALQALKALRSVTKSGVSYREYSPRVLDTKVKVDQYLQSPEAGDAETRAAVALAMRYYELASKAWNYRIREPLGGFIEVAKTVEGDKALGECPAVKKLVEEGDLEARKRGRTGIERLRVVGIQIAFGVPEVWTCASDKIAEAERLLSQK